MKFVRFIFFLFLFPFTIVLISGCSKIQPKILHHKPARLSNSNKITYLKLISLKNYESVTADNMESIKTIVIDKIHSLTNWQEETITKSKDAKFTYSFIRDINGIIYSILTFHSSPQGLKWYKHNFIKEKAKIQLREFSGFVLTDIHSHSKILFVKYAMLDNRQSIEYRALNPYNEILSTFWISKKKGALLKYVNHTVNRKSSKALKNSLTFIVKKIGKIKAFKEPAIISVH